MQILSVVQQIADERRNEGSRLTDVRAQCDKNGETIGLGDGGYPKLLDGEFRMRLQRDVGYGR